MSSHPLVRATPFHARAAASNLFNRWTARNGFTLADDYGDALAEALAGRTTVIVADISWRWRVFIEGASAAGCISRLMTKDVNALAPGASLKALWLADGGAVRGAAVVARFASDQFLLASAATDAGWIAEAARRFGASLRDATLQEGGLALIGPYAEAVLQAAGLGADIVPLCFRRIFWRGLDVTVSRWGEQDGYEIWCKADDCLILWDRLMRAGAQFGIQPAGVSATDILDVEIGVPRPHRDYRPASDGFATDPTPASLGLETLIDEAHAGFNGYRAWLAARGSEKSSLVAVEIDSEAPASFTPLCLFGKVIGHTLTSVHSPVLRRAIALARIDKAHAAPGTVLSLQSPLSLASQSVHSVAARVASFPFVKPTAPL
ncbi:MAG TPA: glycine cleavage T C-terminal barrel domain-containing protein [Rhizomicrobium sp.]|nr:glycine cleavage T C-terminal barrel domain-containing protein [Rhizomicrobium sp.]